MAALAAPRPETRSWAGSSAAVAVVTAVALPMLLTATEFILMWLPVGPVLTRLSGNIAISDADTDAPVILAGLAAGLGIGVLLALGVRWEPSADRPGRPAPDGQESR